MLGEIEAIPAKLSAYGEPMNEGTIHALFLGALTEVYEIDVSFLED